jgi:uncharacterized protein YndB with AHSA1/START domain
MESQSNNAQLVISKEFDAPKENVFNAFADPAALAQWWGPPGIPITVEKFEFKPGGIFLYKGEIQGQTMWGRFIYKQINKPDLLEFISSFSDQNGGITRAPFSDKFPLEIFNRFEFSEQDGRTTITLKGYPVNASEDELKMYIQATAGIQQGLAGTLNQLQNYLAAIDNH